MSSSCFKIISCGKNDSFDNEEDHVEPSPQGKDKRGWSFRKRSARHRVLSNTVISETPSSGNKATNVSAALDFQHQPVSDVPEKVPAVVLTEDKSKLSMPVSSKLSETIAANAAEPNADAKLDDSNVNPNEANANPDEREAKPHEPDADSNLDDSVAIVIQSAVRAYLAQKVLSKNKNIIKLQAAVRGHLERRHAVGTLRCVQAIIKMQVLVRERRARMLLEESPAVKGHRKGKENAPHVTYTSIEKLLSNRFAQQLMDTTPRTKAINIKCDPLKSDSAWKWLERWVAVSPSDDQPPLGTVAQHEKNKEQTPTQESASLIPDKEEIGIVSTEHTVVLNDQKEDKHSVIQEQISVLDDEKESGDFAIQEKMVVPSESNCKPEFSSDSEVTESDSKLIMHDENRLGSEAHEATSTLSNSVNTKSVQSNSLSDKNEESELPSTGQLNVDAKTGTRSEQTFESEERSALENSETQEEKLISGSRKTINPNFIAAQSKFKELSSVSNLTKSMSSTSQTAEGETYVDAESKFKELSSVASLTKSMSSTNQTDGAFLDALSSFNDRASRKEYVPVEDLTSSSSKIQLVKSDTSEMQLGSDASKIQLGGSECGTELSITSTLDSPERSDVGPSEFELGSKLLEDMNGNPQSKDSLAVEAKVEPTILNAHISEYDAIQPERHASFMAEDDHAASSVTVEVPKVEQKPETDVSEFQLEMEPEKGNFTSKPSPEASPRTHITASEPQGTPSSEVSVKPKRTKGEKSTSNHKLRSFSAGKTSPSNSNHGSGRSSAEQSHKDHKSVKRRNSFGSPKPEHVDQEPRDSSSSNPLPSYMQPTQSAKAKALLNSSPRSSPDVLDKDVSLKKRHSLPGANGSQGSPQIQRTSSEVPHTVKGNESQSQQDKKWRR